MKKILFVFLTITLVTGCSCGLKSYRYSKKYNKDTARIDQKVDGMNLQNTEIIYKDGVSYFSVQVKNNTKSDYSIEEYDITFYDEKGKKLTTIPGYIGATIKAGEFKVINSSVDIDLSKIAKIKYKVVK